MGGKNKKTNKNNPNQVEGFYLGSREVPDKKKKSGVSYIHIFQTPEGNLGVWGKTDLDRKILAVAPGTMVRATFASMRSTPNGDMYVYKVEVDTDNTITPPVSNTKAASSNTNDEYEPSAGANEEDNEDEENDDGASEALARQTANASNTERQARVQALLNKNKGK